MKIIDYLAAWSLVLTLGACSAPKVQESDITGDFKLDQVPQGYQDKFQIAEAEKPATVESPAPVEVKEDPKKKEKKTVEPPKPVAKVAFQYPSRRKGKNPAWVGEKQTLDITFYGMLAGTFDLEVLPNKVVNNREVQHFKAHAVSSKLFSFVYTLDDTIESFYDFDGLFSHRFQLYFKESKQTRNSMELYDSEKKETFYHNRSQHLEKGFSEDKLVAAIDPFPQDMISFLYHLRFVDLPDGETVKFPIVSEGKNWEANVSVIRREYMDTPLGRVRTVLVKPETKFNGRLEKKGDNLIWLTDDDRRFLARVELKIRIGTIKARLAKVELGQPPTK